MNELYRRYKDQGLVLIGIHRSGGIARVQSFRKDLGVRWPMGVDVNDMGWKAFQVAAAGST